MLCLSNINFLLFVADDQLLPGAPGAIDLQPLTYRLIFICFTASADRPKDYFNKAFNIRILLIESITFINRTLPIDLYQLSFFNKLSIVPLAIELFQVKKTENRKRKTPNNGG